MLASPSLEYDIRARTRSLAQALASHSNLPIDFPSLLATLDVEASEIMPSPDQLTWFALERLAEKTGMPAVKFATPGQAVSAASLVWVAPNIEPNLDDARELAKAPLVVASEAWSELIRQVSAKPRRPGP